MKRACLFVLLAVCCTNMIDAQKVETFYDYTWKPCEPGSARFFSVVTKTDTGYVRYDSYLPSNLLQMQGLYKDSACLIKNGLFYYCYPEKVRGTKLQLPKLSSFGQYIDNKKEGLWISFHPNGLLKDSTVYDAGEQVGTALHWYNNGFIQDSVVHRPDGTSVSVSWFDNGVVSSAGRLNMVGSYNGKWQFFHRNGQLSAEEVYDNGKLVSRKYFSEDGTLQNDILDKSKSAEFPGGITAWTNFLENHLYWPANYQLVNGDKAEIGVDFMVDEKGNIKDININTPFETVFNDIVINTLKSSPKWNPAISHNRKVSYHHSQTIAFKQVKRY